MRKLLLTGLILLTFTACYPIENHRALGTLERDRVTFSATASEIIRELPIKEGNRVSEGDVLVQLDTKNQQSLLAHAIAEQAKASAYLLKLTNGERPEDIASAQARVVRSQAKLTEAQKNYQRKAELVAKKLISQSEKDTALAARDSARAELDSANEEFDKLTSGARPEDIEQARASLAAANADVALQQQKLDELTVVATRSGVLDNLPYNLGERVPVNGIVAIVQAGDIPYARVYVPANYRVGFVPDKQVQVFVDGIETPFDGRVRWVSSEAAFTPYYALTQEERARLMYLAEVDLNQAALELPSGLSAQVVLDEE